MTLPELSVVVATRDRPLWLARCLDALLTQETQRAYEVVIANDGGGLPPLTQLEDPRVVVVMSDGSGPAKARNRGVEAARGPLILFTDDDTVPARGWLEAAAATLDAESDAVGVEGPVDGGEFDPLFEHSIKNELPGAYYTCNVGYRRAEFLGAGGFDVGYPTPHCEDIDLGRRMAHRGPIVFNPAMRVIHPPRPIGFWEQARRGRLVESEWRLHHKHPETRPPRWSVRWGPWIRIARRWQRQLRDEALLRRSPKHVLRAAALGLAQLAFGLHTTLTRWDAMEPAPARKRQRVFGAAVNVVNEVRSFARISGGGHSLARFALDAVAYRTLRLAPQPTLGNARSVTLSDGLVLTYRRNRGDIQTIREVWLDEAYRLPFDLTPRSVLDLGANIGLASLWFSHVYGSRVTAVEPLAANVAVLRENFQRNGVDGEIVHAAVGPEDGHGRLEEGMEPNLGRLGASGIEVDIVGITSLLERLGRVDLVKLDIEGGEASLLTTPVWLDACDSLIVEFHPALVDRDQLVATIRAQGFDFYPAGSVLRRTADFFVRPEAKR